MPRIQQAYSKHSGSVTVEFTEVGGASSYALRAESLDGSFFSEMVVSGSPGTVVQLQPYTSYRLSVMSVNSGGRSQPSPSIQARTGKLSQHCPKCMASSEDQIQPFSSIYIHFHSEQTPTQRRSALPAWGE